MSKAVELSQDVNGYFDDAIQQAIATRRVDATEAATCYLSGLLLDYAHGSKRTADLEKPLTFQLRDALAAPRSQRFDRLRAIGDGVLYVLGFFGECFVRRGADPNYIIRVGASAYGHASGMLQVGGGGRDAYDVLDELARKFERFVEVMREVASGISGSPAGSARHILGLYERWQKTGSPQVASELAGYGLCPSLANKGLH